VSAHAPSWSPWIVAHRGASGECPENTQAAFARAVALRADGIELDLQLTADGHVVVFHDRTLAKVGHGRRPLAECAWAELQTLDVGAWKGRRFRGERIPTLDEVLARWGPRTRLALELKAEPHMSAARRARLVDATLAALGGARTREVFMLSFDADLLARVARRRPELPRVLDVDREIAPRLLARVLATVDVLCPPARLVSRRLGEAVRGRDRALWAYRCDSRDALQRARRAGAAALICDHPDVVRARLP
jgi:glycerophosphoryl diester phosphodiesterase